MSFIYNLIYGAKDREISTLEENVSDLNNQINIIKKKLDTSEDPEPSTISTINFSDLFKLLSPICSNVYISDEVFSLTSREEAAVFSLKTKVAMKKWTQEAHDCPIDKETAWAHGLFFSDGTCGIDKNGCAFWKISNTNLDFLLRAKKAYESEWCGFNFIIKTYPSQEKGKITNYGKRNKTLYELQMSPKVRSGTYGLRKELIQIFLNTFYFKNYKKIPAALWEQDRSVKIKFLEGVIAGDGCKSCNRITIKGKFGLVGLMDCMNDAGWKSSPYMDKRKEDIWYIGYDRRNEYIPLIADFVYKNKSVSLKEIKKEFERKSVYKAIKLLTKEGYLVLKYQNPNNKSNGYVESIKQYPIACDNFSFALMGYWSDGLKSFPFGMAWSQNHAFNFMIDSDKNFWIVEPQTNQWMTLEEAKKASSPDGLSYFPIRIMIC